MDTVNSTRRQHLSDAGLHALATMSATPEHRRAAAEHLLGTAENPPCLTCHERLADEVLKAHSHLPKGSEPRVLLLAALELRDGFREAEPPLLERILGGASAADPDELARWKKWADSRRGIVEPSDVAPVLLASYRLRFNPEASDLLELARVAASMADASSEPRLQALAYGWLSRVRAIRGELRDAGREVEAARKAAEQINERPDAALAYVLHMQADHRMRLRDFGPSQDRFEKAIAYYRACGDPGLAHSAEVDLGINLLESGQYEAAKTLLVDLLARAQDRLVTKSALQNLAGEVLPHLAVERFPELADLCVCLDTLIGREEAAPALSARTVWRWGRMAWALGAPDIALARFREARETFLEMSNGSLLGFYEAASLSLDMMEVLLRVGGLREMQEQALAAVETFKALGVDNAALVALGCLRQIQLRVGAAAALLGQLRISVEVAERRRLAAAHEGKR